MSALIPPTVIHSPSVELMIDKLSSHYQGVSVLHELSLVLEQGQILALLGPSGCGKSTLLRAIAGLQPMSAGTLILSGKTLCSPEQFVPAEQRGMGMIFQDYALFPHLNVADNIVFGLSNTPKAHYQAIVDDMLALVRLEGLGHRYPHELSGGQQQRVAIARALAYQPRLLLLDEPFSNIDAQVRQALMSEIRDILKARQVSAVFVTHSKEEAFAFADQLAILAQGSILQQGPAQSLYARPSSPYVANYLGQANYAHVTVMTEHQVDSPLGVVVSSEPLAQAIGTQGQLLVRPESLRLTANEQGAGQVIQRQFLGYGCDYLVALGELQWQVRSTQPFELGARVDIEVLRHPLIIFPSQ
ncbi:ABC transporter ATP-binding protein [Shewanella sp. NIFS-20-20]|uniref:ABC transporter ATP-binding protein n=1 Tax=Shewanella sp. NIFS-20-20 TaxID=2853806 RepID=UPI001C445EA7|nr:ABC transporter ATP-binding protein [Shewanella sp. NIFS-20-20]MBV7314648.1 ABC transporter ATP-binding protein [Shewanella sp. NIFS-20-20]